MIKIIQQNAMDGSRRSRGWCWTLNNYTAEEVEACKEIECEYLVFGKEVGESGTPHLQGYIWFKSLKSFKQVKKAVPKAHLEPAKADTAKNRTYCTKDGEYFEKGTPPKTSTEKGEAEKERWKRVLKKAKEGDMQWLEENEPQLVLMHKPMLKSHAVGCDEVMTYADEDSPHEWWVGGTGTGKSRRLWELYPTRAHKYKKAWNKWWDGYEGQDVMYLEEASGHVMGVLAQSLKEWSDRYPFDGQIKYGKLEGIRPKKVIVLSNYTIRECFPDSKDYEPLERRFKVTEFKKPGPPVGFRTATSIT